MIIIKKIVFSICILYSVNIILATKNKVIPINFYTLALTYFFDFFAILAIIYLKYYCWGEKNE